MKLLIVIFSFFCLSPLAFAEDYPCGYKTKRFALEGVQPNDWLHPNGQITIDYFGNLYHPDGSKVSSDQSMRESTVSTVYAYRSFFETVKEGVHELIKVKALQYQYSQGNIVIQYTVSGDGKVSDVSCQTKNWNNLK